MSAVEGEVARFDVGEERAVVVVVGDLTTQDADAVVNPANESLSHGGGVAKALAEAGGVTVTEESEQWVARHGELGPGDTAVTGAGDLRAQAIVHVVGPRWREDRDNEALLRQAVRAALDSAAGIGAGLVAMPAISAGVFGYPPAEAGRVIAEEGREWMSEHKGPLFQLRLVALDEEAAGHFAAGLAGGDSA